MNTKDDTFVTYRKRRSRYTEDFEDIQLEDTNSDMDPTGTHSDRGKGTGEDEDRMEFRNLVSALQDLAKGKKMYLMQSTDYRRNQNQVTTVHLLHR